ncbi:Gfo/Idh/MocA family protein [Virgibacillus natechei]
MQHVVVVGLGTMGSVHANAFARMENVELLGVVDRNEHKISSYASELNTRGFLSLDSAFENLGEKVDVVSVCLPTDDHITFVKQAADAGVHVICEKPIARSTEKARELIDYCNTRGVQLFVGHVVRFFQEYVKAKEVIDSDKIGRVSVVRTRRGGSFPIVPSDWYSDYMRSGGVIMDTIVHDFDYLRWCFGEVERVYAKNIAGTTGINQWKRDYALVTLRFTNGIIAHVEGTWAHRQFATSFEFAGTDGVITYDGTKEKAVVTEHAEQSNRAGANVAVPESPLKLSPYDQELRHFIDCIENAETPVVTAEDAYKAVEIACAALRSIEEGKSVELKGGEIR